MKTACTSVLLAFALVCATTGRASAQDRGSVSFVTGFSMSNGSAIADTLAAISPGINNRLNLSGRVGINLTPGFQVVGEVGRLGNVLPPLTSSILSFSRVDVRASALYAEGGMRASMGRSSVSPYIEATGGVARTSVRINGLSATIEDLTDLGFGFADRTSPTAGLGAGVVMHAGPLVMDAGYRYKKIFSGDFVSTLLNGGGQLTSHQAVFGVGVRF